MPSKNYSRKTLANKDTYAGILKKNSTAVIKGKRYQDPETKEAKLLQASQRLKSTRLGTVNMQKTEYGDEISSSYHILQCMGITPNERSTSDLSSRITQTDKTAFMAKSNPSQKTKMRNFKAGTISPKFAFTDYRGSFYNLEKGPSRAKKTQMDKFIEKRTMVDPSDIALRVVNMDTKTFGYSRSELITRQNQSAQERMREPTKRKSGIPYADRRRAPTRLPSMLNKFQTADAVDLSPRTSQSARTSRRTPRTSPSSANTRAQTTTARSSTSTLRRTPSRGTGY